jgi:hypothetical protein
MDHRRMVDPRPTPAQSSVRAQDKAASVPVPAPPRISHAPALDATLLSRPRAEQPPTTCPFFAACTAPVRPQEPQSRIPVRSAARALVPRVRIPQGGANLPPPEPALSSHTVPDTPYLAPRIRHHYHGDSQAPRPPATTPPTAPSTPFPRPLLDLAPRWASRPDVVATPRSIRHHIRFSLLAPASRQERPAVP